MAHQDVADAVLLEKRIIEVKHGPAWITEHVFGLLMLQAPD
jgi:hypothetical protein